MKKNLLFRHGTLFTIMRVTFCQLLLGSLLSAMCYAHTTPAQDLLNREISLRAKKTSLKEVLSQIERGAGVQFAYCTDCIDLNEQVSLDVKKEHLAVALNKLFVPLDMNYRVVNNQILISKNQSQAADQDGASKMDMAADQNVRGKVTDDQGAGLPGVSILVKGTQQGTTTDAEGNFTINVPGASSVLVFSFVGYKPQEVTVGNSSNLAIKLETDTKSLNEVVVTALGIKKDAKVLGYSVTKVAGESLTKTRETNIANSLVGKVAGVNVSAAATGPAGSSRVAIRGNSSISYGNTPLFIINGLPMNSGRLGGNAGDVPDWGDNMSSLNPDDIEEMTVLKGATAAALYGSRAKAGAIIITTKSGKGSKGIGVEFNSNNTFEVPFFLWELQKEYGQGMGGVKPTDVFTARNHSQNHWGAKYDGSNVIQLDGVERPYSYVKDQVLKDFYGVGHTSTNNVSFTAGNEKSSFRVGITDMRNKGIIPNAKMRRDNIALALTHNFAKNLTMTANVDYINEEVNNRYSFNSSQSNMAGTILWLNSNMPTSALSPGYDPVTLAEKVSGTDLNATNPYYVLNRMSNRTQKDRFISTLNLRWNITDWLFIQGKAGQDYYNFNINRIIPAGTGYRPLGQIDQSQNTFYERNFEGLIGLDRKLSNDLSLNVNVGGNMMSTHSEALSIVGTGIVVPNLNVINNTSQRVATTGLGNTKINSLFGTAELGFRNYLFLNVTGRNDWFSTLNPKSNSYFYPSAGLSFVLSDAVELPKAINFSKLRVAYASVGGGADEPYLLDLTYGLLGYNYGTTPLGTINQADLPNSNLKPLAINEFEVGLDLRMFNSRLNFDIAAYNKITSNDIVKESISSTSGYATTVANIGKIRNRGIEFLINVKPLVRENFSWDVSLNTAYNKSIVLQLANSSKELTLATSTKAFIKHIEGQEFSQIVGRTIEKNAKGQDYIDANGLPFVTTTYKSFGSGVHRWTSGIINNFNYKSFTLSAQVDGKFGGKIYSETNYSLEHRGMTPGSLIGREDGVVLPGVTKDEQPNTKRITAVQASNRAIIVRRRDALDDYLYNASFIKFRYVSLTYNLPKHIYQKLGFVKGASISAVGRNLAILMKHTPGLDPETNISAGNDQGIESTALPPTRSYGFNVNLKF